MKKAKIARMARERIDKLQPRKPGTPFLLKALPEPRDMQKVLVISDIHLGDAHSLLMDSSTIQALTGAISGMGRVDELVLLGDVFDFWQSPFTEAVAMARDFLAALYTLENVERIVYVVGNHDHHVFRMWYETEVSKRFLAGELEEPGLTMPLTDQCPVMEPLKPADATVPLFMTYPVHQLQVCGKSVELTHGHMLGFYERSLWSLRKRSSLGSVIMSKQGTIDLDDMEKFMSPFYEMTALSTLIPKVVEGRHLTYRAVDKTSGIWGVSGETRASFDRGNPIEKCAVAIEALLDHFFESKPDYFVFGHTHMPGILELPVSGTIAVNSGCWLGGLNTEENRKIIVEIAEEVRLIRVA
jgi:UDP-2,3-diacylglucosamine pyrophosphatase LpxH